MFYQVKIGTVTRRGMYVWNVESVVNFDGSASELKNVMVKKYEGFTIGISEIKEVKIVEKEVVKIGALTGNRYSQKLSQMKSINTFFEKSDNILIDYIKAVEELSKAKTAIFKAIRLKLEDRIEILTAESFSITADNYVSYVLILDGTLSIEN